MTEGNMTGDAFWGDVDTTQLFQNFHTLVETADFGFYQLDSNGRFVGVNNAMSEITGYTPEELIDSHVSLLLTDATIERVEEDTRNRLKRGRAPTNQRTFDLLIETADGVSKPCEIRVSLLTDDGDFCGTFGTVHEASDRNRSEQTLTFRKLPEQRLNDREAMIREIHEVISDGDRSFEEKVDGLLGIGQDVIGTDYGSLSQVSNEKYRFKVVRAPDDAIQAGDVVPRSATVCERVIRTGESLVLEDIAVDAPALADRAKNAEWGIACYLAAPVFKNGDIYGTFCFYDDEVRDEPFSDWEIALVDLLSRWVTSELERKEREEALRESEEKFRQLATHLEEVIYIESPDRDEIHYVNPSYETVWGRNREHLYDNPTAFVDAIHPDDRERVRKLVEEQTEYETEYRIVHPDGSERWIHDRTNTVCDEAGTVTRIVGIASDITDRKVHEQYLQDAKEQLEAATEAGAIGTWEWDVSNNKMHVSAKLATLFGIDPDTVREGVPLDRFLSSIYVDDRERVEQKINTAIETCGEYKAEFRVWDDDDELRWVVARGHVECDEDGNARSFPGALTDITERKQYQRKLEESNERLEQFAYAASHDLQEPLRMITSYLNLIERRYDEELDEDGQEFLEFAVDGAERMREMIDALLEYSRVETRGEPFGTVNLDEVLENVRTDLQLQIEQSDAEITAESLPHVHGDGGQLRQVFQNLVSNAIKYSGDEPPRVHISAAREDSKWRISVRDEGIGVNSSDSNRVFEVFQRFHSYEEHEGTGIGLALCKRIVERHGGEIWVESEPGEGATFLFTLPPARDLR